jgi:hypothetical protein
MSPYRCYRCLIVTRDWRTTKLGTVTIVVCKDRAGCTKRLAEL